MSLIESKTREYIEEIESPDTKYDALIREVGRHDIALLATGEELRRPRIEVVDFGFSYGPDVPDYIASELHELHNQGWVYEFRGGNRKLDNSEITAEIEGEIYLGENVNQERLEEFCEIFYGYEGLWDELEVIHVDE